MCTPGTYGAAGAVNEDDCLPCPAGQFDDDLDPATVCTDCPAATYRTANMSAVAYTDSDGAPQEAGEQHALRRDAVLHERAP